MFAGITRVKTRALKRASETVKAMEIPEINRIPGFVAYYVVPAKDEYTTVAIFEDASGFEKWKKLCRESFKVTRPHLQESDEPIHVTSGHVVFSRTARREHN